MRANFTMNVLAINCGSSTLKFRVLAMEGDRPRETLATGMVDRIGAGATARFNWEGSNYDAQLEEVNDHAGATRAALEWLSSFPLISIDAVGHRIVHGGAGYAGPALLTDATIAAIEGLNELAPLHNPPALEAIGAARATLGQDGPMVATFDTAFFRGMPERATHYAVSHDLGERHGVRRYGFHGLAHRYMVERYAEVTERPLDGTRLITFQLGNGCSAAAIDGGRPVDTSMGFTPLEGLVMGTRSGDVDPAVIAHLAKKNGWSAEQVVDVLNTESGLLGVSGLSPDMRELLVAEAAGDEHAALAIELFCYRAKKYLGAYLAALGGADAMIFGGGIGENAPQIRAYICEGMEWLGMRIDRERNEATVGCEGRISADDSRVDVRVAAVDEELIIARDTVRCIEASGAR